MFSRTSSQSVDPNMYPFNPNANVWSNTSGQLHPNFGTPMQPQYATHFSPDNYYMNMSGPTYTPSVMQGGHPNQFWNSNAAGPPPSVNAPGRQVWGDNTSSGSFVSSNQQSSDQRTDWPFKRANPANVDYITGIGHYSAEMFNFSAPQQSYSYQPTDMIGTVDHPNNQTVNYNSNNMYQQTFNLSSPNLVTNGPPNGNIDFLNGSNPLPNNSSANFDSNNLFMDSTIEQNFANLNIRTNGFYPNGTNSYSVSDNSNPANATFQNSSNGMPVSLASNGSETAVQSDSLFSSTSASTNTNNHAATTSTSILEAASRPGPFITTQSGLDTASNQQNVPISADNQKKSWASIASQPAKGSAATMASAATYKKQTSGFGSSTGGFHLNNSNSMGGSYRSNISGAKSGSNWSSENNNTSKPARGFPGNSGENASINNGSHSASSSGKNTNTENSADMNALAKSINPKNFDINPKKARFFVMKSYSEDDIFRSIKYSIWCSTETGNKKLDAAYRESTTNGQSTPVYLFFSVNGSGHFCGMARMTSSVDSNLSAGVWSQDKWKGQLRVQWIYVKDVPNSHLRHIRIETNENKPVTNSRDATEVPYEKGKQVLKVISTFKNSTSIFDDFLHYEKREVQDTQKRS